MDNFKKIFKLLLLAGGFFAMKKFETSSNWRQNNMHTYTVLILINITN